MNVWVRGCVVGSLLAGAGCRGNDNRKNTTVDPPEAPVRISVRSVVDGAGTVRVTWEPSERAVVYRVYRADGALTAFPPDLAAFDPPTHTVETALDVAGFDGGTEYTFAVTAINSAGESVAIGPVVAEPAERGVNVPYLSLIPNWRMSGTPGSCYGGSLAMFRADDGDGVTMDGDTFADFAIAAPYADIGPPVSAADAGQVFYFRGTSAGPQTGNPVARGGGVGNEKWGFGLAATGDQDDNGFDDHVTGRPDWMADGMIMTFREAPQGASLAGYTPTYFGAQQYGTGLVGGGDLNGDGRADFVVLSPRSTSLSGFAEGGQVDLFVGSSTFFISGPSAITAPAQTNEHFGTAAAFGDLTGDGFGDIAISSERGDGRVYFFHFGEGLSAPAGMLDGAEIGAGFGRALATLDVDGDGTREAIIGAPGAGRIYVADGASFAVLGSAGMLAGSSFGSSLAVVRDADGDGIDDLIAGAPLAGTGGEVHLLLGQPGGLELAEVRAGVAADGRFGSALATGDVNGDGSDDVLVGAARCDLDGNIAGEDRAYLYLGVPRSPFPGPDVALDGPFEAIAGEPFDLTTSFTDSEGFDAAIGNSELTREWRCVWSSAELPDVEQEPCAPGSPTSITWTSPGTFVLRLAVTNLASGVSGASSTIVRVR